MHKRLFAAFLAAMLISLQVVTPVFALPADEAIESTRDCLEEGNTRLTETVPEKLSTEKTDTEKEEENSSQKEEPVSEKAMQGTKQTVQGTEKHEPAGTVTEITSEEGTDEKGDKEKGTKEKGTEEKGDEDISKKEDDSLDNVELTNDLDEDIASPSELEDEDIKKASPSNGKYASPEMELTWSDGIFRIVMHSLEGAFELPSEDTVLRLDAEPIIEDELEKLLDTIEDEKKVKVEKSDAVAYDIRILDEEDTEYQPVKGQNISMTFENLYQAVNEALDHDTTALMNNEEADDASEEISGDFKDIENDTENLQSGFAAGAVDIYHFDSAGKDVEQVKAETDTDAPENVSVEAEHLSPWVFTTPHNSSIGDLWDNWDQYAADAYKPSGLGTESSPYLIESLGNLMWLSVQTVKGAAAASAHYRLETDIDIAALAGISGAGQWHPIGWYANKDSSDYSSVRPFKGIFDGNDHTIEGLELVDTGGNDLQYTGLFGAIQGGTVKDLTVLASTVSGYDYVGILAGYICEDSNINGVTVSGAANAGISVSSDRSYNSAHVGGIAGEVNGSALTADDAVVIENCTATNINLDSSGWASTVGGIAGSATKAYIVDSKVITSGSLGIQGYGYVGGIVGYQSSTNIYNSYIEGIIGGNNTVAVGGVTGNFISGEIYVVQMDGEIASTHRATTHEGIIVGTRAAGTTFVYGTNKTNNAGYLFYDSALKGKAVCASGISGDASGFTQAANIGYWKDNSLKYVLMQGSNEFPCASDRFYYEELEDGVRFVVTQKLDREFTVEDYANGLRFAIDHYAPGQNGSPVLGHLVSIPQINAINSMEDLDVAVMTAIGGEGSIYYKTITKDTASAVAAGTTIRVNTAAKNVPAENKYYQRVVDMTVEPEHLKRPTYTDETGYPEEMTYMTGGAYTFTMPDCDTELNVEYEKVISKIVTSPTSTTFNLVQTRYGNRKSPKIKWQIRDGNHNLLCESEELDWGAAGAGQFLENTDVSAININVLFNAVSENNWVKWSVDDASLINLVGPGSDWSKLPAQIKPQVTQANNIWLAGIIATEEQKQANANYTVKIPATQYTKSAVLTAYTDPDHSVNNISAYAHCDVTFNFQIVDNTQLHTEGISLNKDALTFKITRKISGNRRNPDSVYEVTAPQALKATITPAEADVRAVTWEMTGDAATSLTKTASGTHDHDLTVSHNFDGSDLSKLPAWIKTIADADDAKKAAGASDAQKNAKLTGSGTKNAVIKVTATDQVLGVHEATANVAVVFETVDTTPDVTDFELNKNQVNLTITRKLTGQRLNPSESYTVSNNVALAGSIGPEPAQFLENVIWSKDVALKDTVTVTPYGGKKENATLALNFDSSDVSAKSTWVYNLISADDELWKADKAHYKRTAADTVQGYVTALTHDVTTSDTGAKAQCLVKVTFVTNDQTIAYYNLYFNMNGHGSQIASKQVECGTKTAAPENPYASGYLFYGWYLDAGCTNKFDFNTTPINADTTLYAGWSKNNSGGGGGSSSGGGGGGSSGGGSGPSGGSSVSKTVKGLPSYVVSGNWTKRNDGTWSFTSSGDNGHVLTNEWVVAVNPYATGNQAAFDWFAFDKNSVMITGWYTDPKDGRRYYLSPVADNTLGHMVVGYQYIGGVWYYFHNISDGTRGRLIVNGLTPNGQRTNALGQIVDSKGRPVTSATAFTVTENTTESLIASGAMQ